MNLKSEKKELKKLIPRPYRPNRPNHSDHSDNVINIRINKQYIYISCIVFTIITVNILNYYYYKYIANYH